MFVTVTVAAVIVLAVPLTLDLMNVLFMTLLPLLVNVPVTVWFAPKIWVDAAFELQESVNVENVFAPVIVREPVESTVADNVA